jgi:hypothetical protein
VLQKHLPLAWILCAWAAAAFSAPPEDERMSRPARQDTLELPGLNAGCHTCEWRPKLNQKPAREQCGNDDNGAAMIGVFECGFSEDCERVCHFIRCGTL